MVSNSPGGGGGFAPTVSLHCFFLCCCVMGVHTVLQIGTNTVALAAKAMNKPVYVVAESLKFARLFPLNQSDVPNQFKVQTVHFIGCCCGAGFCLNQTNRSRYEGWTCIGFC